MASVQPAADASARRAPRERNRWNESCLQTSNLRHEGRRKMKRERRERSPAAAPWTPQHLRSAQQLRGSGSSGGGGGGGGCGGLLDLSREWERWQELNMETPAPQLPNPASCCLTLSGEKLWPTFPLPFFSHFSFFLCLFFLIHFISTLLSFRCTCIWIKSLLWHCSKLYGLEDFWRKKIRRVLLTSYPDWLKFFFLISYYLVGGAVSGETRRKEEQLLFVFFFCLFIFRVWPLGRSGLNPLLRPPAPPYIPPRPRSSSRV